MITLQATKRALGPGLTASFLASGGTAPYVYTMAATGAGGTINASTGLYTAPAEVPSDPDKFFDTIKVTDNVGATKTLKILVGTPWMLFWEVLQSVLKLSPEMIWFQNQKQFEPTDATKGMWVVLMFPNLKAFASGLHPAGTGNAWDKTEKWANFSGPVDIHIMSRDSAALNRKEEVVMALTGPYARAQQTANSFYIGRIPHNIVDISGVDGAAIPWHFVVSVELQYGSSKVFDSEYFDDFLNPQIVINE